MSSYTLDADAVFDLEEITSFIAEDSPDAARQLATRLFLAFDMLARTPGIGHRRRDLTAELVLFWSLERYVLIYRETAFGVQVVAVTQGSRDLTKLLRRRMTEKETASSHAKGEAL